MSRSLPPLLLAVTATALLALAPGCYESSTILADAGDDVLPPREDEPGESSVDAADTAPDARDSLGDHAPADRSDAPPDRPLDDSSDGLPDAVDADAETEAEAEADITDATETDADSDADVGPETCAGGWLDPSSGLCWQNPSSPSSMSWSAATSYCATSELGGLAPGSWHVPTIDELRSLVRGCSRIETGGACGVTDDCLEYACWMLTSCMECLAGSGPAPGGAFWPDELAGAVRWYWSSSSFADDPSRAWFLTYYGADISWDLKTSPGFVRCVRPGP
jgi:hypothetical protein